MRDVNARKQSTVVWLSPTCQCSDGFISRRKLFTILDTKAPPNVMTTSGANHLFSSAVIALKVVSIRLINSFP